MTNGFVHCSRCGKRVSNTVLGELTVRAWVECPECIEAQPDREALIVALLEATDPFPSSLEERGFGGVDLEQLWEQLAEAVGFTRSADEGSPTKWDKR